MSISYCHSSNSYCKFFNFFQCIDLKFLQARKLSNQEMKIRHQKLWIRQVIRQSLFQQESAEWNHSFFSTYLRSLSFPALKPDFRVSRFFSMQWLYLPEKSKIFPNNETITTSDNKYRCGTTSKYFNYE